MPPPSPRPRHAQARGVDGSHHFRAHIALRRAERPRRGPQLGAHSATAGRRRPCRAGGGSGWSGVRGQGGPSRRTCSDSICRTCIMGRRTTSASFAAARGLPTKTGMRPANTGTDRATAGSRSAPSASTPTRFRSHPARPSPAAHIPLPARGRVPTGAQKGAQNRKAGEIPRSASH